MDIKSDIFLKPKLRLPYQTTSFIYKALDIAEAQVKEQSIEFVGLRKENRRLTLLSRNKKIRR